MDWMVDDCFAKRFIHCYGGTPLRSFFIFFIKKPPLNSLSPSVRLLRIDRGNAACRAECAIGWSSNSKIHFINGNIALVAHHIL